MFLRDYISHVANNTGYKMWLSNRGIYTYDLNVAKLDRNMILLDPDEKQKICKSIAAHVIHIQVVDHPLHEYIIVEINDDFREQLKNANMSDDYNYAVNNNMLYKIPKNNAVMMRDTALHDAAVSVTFIASVQSAICRDIRWEIIIHLLNLCRCYFNNYVAI